MDWTRRLFNSLYANPERRKLWGLSIHYYTSGSATKFAGGDALRFNNNEYYDLLARGTLMNKIIRDHWLAMGSSPGQPSVKLVVDEWGAWYGDGTRLGAEYNLSQQSTMRDALLSAMTFDIFHQNAEKVGVAAVAQSINCLNSLMLAREDKFTLTPVFYIFQMYLPHQGAMAVRTEFTASSIDNPLGNAPVQVGGNSYRGEVAPLRTLAGLSGSASLSGNYGGAGAKKEMTLSVVNPHLDRPMTTEVSVRGAGILSATGSVLVSRNVHDHNDFASPNNVRSAPATNGLVRQGKLIQTFPPASVTVLTLSVA